MKMRRFVVPIMVCALGMLGACNELDVHDPTVIQDENLNNAAGADLLRKDAVRTWYQAVSYGAVFGGILSDEMQSEVTDEGRQLLDRRESLPFQVATSSFNYPYYYWQWTRRNSIVALQKLKDYGVEPSRSPYIAEMLAARGYTTMRLAEDFCPGFPLHDFVDFKEVFGGPMSTEAAFTVALADFDSALAFAGDSARFKNLISVSRGRTLLGLGKFAEAAAAVSAVPTTFVFNAEFSTSADLNNQFAFISRVRTVANLEGSVGLDYLTSNDPRSATIAGGKGPLSGQAVRVPTKFSTASSPMPIANGIEARLIEAEAALKAGSGTWLTILNNLRATAITPALPALADPATANARVDLLFRERAFWLFLTGHRVGDMRRLITFYGRTADSVFPSGQYKFGNVYGTATAIPFPSGLETPHNPAVTGCTTR
jgi:starch-binding outer membrane protein, SusD/RagB family